MSKIQISLVTRDIDDIMLERLHRRLRITLEDAEIGDVGTTRAEDPGDGTRSSGPVLLGILTVLASSGLKEIAVRLSTAVSAFVRKNGSPISIKIGDNEITIDKPTLEQSEELIGRFLKAVDDE